MSEWFVTLIRTKEEYRISSSVTTCNSWLQHRHSSPSSSRLLLIKWLHWQIPFINFHRESHEMESLCKNTGHRVYSHWRLLYRLILMLIAMERYNLSSWRGVTAACILVLDCLKAKRSNPILDALDLTPMDLHWDVSGGAVDCMRRRYYKPHLATFLVWLIALVLSLSLEHHVHSPRLFDWQCSPSTALLFLFERFNNIQVSFVTLIPCDNVSRPWISVSVLKRLGLKVDRWERTSTMTRS